MIPERPEPRPGRSRPPRGHGTAEDRDPRRSHPAPNEAQHASGGDESSSAQSVGPFE